MLNENSYLSFGPGTREQQEQIAAGVLALVGAVLIDLELSLRGAVAQAYQAGYNRGAAAGESASWALAPKS